MSQTPKAENGFMVKLATFIVDKRNLFFLITVILLVFPHFPGTGSRWKTT